LEPAAFWNLVRAASASHQSAMDMLPKCHKVPRGAHGDSTRTVHYD